MQINRCPTLIRWQSLSLIGGDHGYRLGHGRSYFSIPLDGDYDYQKIGIGIWMVTGNWNMSSDSRISIRSYQQPGYGNRAPRLTNLKPMKWTELSNGAMTWAGRSKRVSGTLLDHLRCRSGRKGGSILQGWRGGPRTERTCESGPEYLVKIDGETGEVVAKTDWIGREGFDSYNYYSRNFLNVAYLDGKTPSIYMQRGTYRLIRARTLDRDFNIIWEWEATGEYEKYRGQSSHGSITTDVDQDGKDEIVIGAAVLDDDGKLWTPAMGHPDVCVADIAGQSGVVTPVLKPVRRRMEFVDART